jgi:hypothetical protein
MLMRVPLPEIAAMLSFEPLRPDASRSSLALVARIET